MTRNVRRVRPTAFVVDDDPSCRELVTGALRRQGFEVTEARDGFEGIRGLLARPGAIGLLIVDTEMPGAHGWEVIRVARTKAPRLRILRLGRPEDEPPGPEYLTFEDTPVLRKPFTEPELLASLADLARGRARGSPARRRAWPAAV